MGIVEAWGWGADEPGRKVREDQADEEDKFTREGLGNTHILNLCCVPSSMLSASSV